MPKESARFAVAGMLVICSGAIYYFVAAGYCSTEWVRTIDIIIGALVANMTTVVAYYFGSSQGSKEKTEIMAQALKRDEQSP